MGRTPGTPQSVNLNPRLYKSRYEQPLLAKCTFHPTIQIQLTPSPPTFCFIPDFSHFEFPDLSRFSDFPGATTQNREMPTWTSWKVYRAQAGCASRSRQDEVSLCRQDRKGCCRCLAGSLHRTSKTNGRGTITTLEVTQLFYQSYSDS